MIYLAWFGIIVVVAAVVAIMTDGFRDFGQFLWFLVIMSVIIAFMVIAVLSISYIHDYYFVAKPKIQLESK